MACSSPSFFPSLSNLVAVSAPTSRRVSAAALAVRFPVEVTLPFISTLAVLFPSAKATAAAGILLVRVVPLFSSSVAAPRTALRVLLASAFTSLPWMSAVSFTFTTALLLMTAPSPSRAAPSLPVILPLPKLTSFSAAPVSLKAAEAVAFMDTSPTAFRLPPTVTLASALPSRPVSVETASRTISPLASLDMARVWPVIPEEAPSTLTSLEKSVSPVRMEALLLVSPTVTLLPARIMTPSGAFTVPSMVMVPLLLRATSAGSETTCFSKSALGES